MKNASTGIAAKAKAFGLTLPYVYGGTATNTAQPVIFVPKDENGPVSDEYNVPLTRAERDAKFKVTDPGYEWFKAGEVTIAGEVYKVYGAHSSKSRKTAPAMVDAVLGDEFARASKEEAKAMAANAIASSVDTLIRELIARNPALKDESRADLLAMVLRG